MCINRGKWIDMGVKIRSWLVRSFWIGFTVGHDVLRWILGGSGPKSVAPEYEGD